MSHTLVERLPTAIPAEVRVTVTRADGSTSSSVAVLVHPPGVAHPLYRVQSGDGVELLTVEEFVSALGLVLVLVLVLVL